MNARKNASKMLLTPSNSTNPLYWGMELNLVYKGNLIDPYQTKLDIPTEFDFFNLWAGKDPINAKQYYGL